MERRRLGEAESLFRRAIEVQPESPVGWTNLGVALSRQRRRAEALVALQHADRLETATGESANNFINLAVELSDAGRLDEALAVYESRRPRRPRNKDQAMARTLDVYLHTDLAGHLTQDDDGDMSFQYAESWLQGASIPS
jgi:tetratricopeptide (TPR) repeat protein